MRGRRNALFPMTDTSTSTTKKGYQGFGSFHSDNVEEMLAAREFIEPAVPAGLDVASLLRAAGVDPESPPPEFGAPMRRFFYLDDEWTFLNHGAFGCVSRVAMKASQAWAEYAESQPLRFIDRQLFALVASTVRKMAARVKTSPRRLVFVPNATTGLNAAISAAGLAAGERVFSLDVGYGSVKKMIAAACSRSGATAVQCGIKFPLDSPAALVDQVSACLASHAGEWAGPGMPFKLGIVDAVTSNTGMVLPIYELVPLLRRYCEYVAVDGAHALQALPLDIDALGADWYVSNAHKWLCSTKGVAILAVSERVRETTHCPIISHGSGSGFSSEFIWDGARDYSGVLALQALLAWWDWVGPAAARGYCESLLQKAVKLLTETWGTRTHVPAPSFYSHMACVGVPPRASPAPEGAPATSDHAKALQDALHFHRKVEVPVKCLEGALYFRISVSVHNCLSDYERLIEAVSSLGWDKATATLLPEAVVEPPKKSSVRK